MRLAEGDVCESLPSPVLPTFPSLEAQLKPADKSHLTQQEQHLLIAKKEIEDAYNSGFWNNIAANMERRGAGKYPGAFLQKSFKELETAGKTTINPVKNATTDNGDEQVDANEEEEDADEGGDA